MELHEQHQMLVETLAELVPVLSCEKLDLLAYHCGVKREEFYPTQKEEAEVVEVIEWEKAA